MAVGGWLNGGLGCWLACEWWFEWVMGWLAWVGCLVVR